MEAFRPIPKDAIEELTQGLVSVIEIQYPLRRASKKRLFLKDRPADFYKSAADYWLFFLKKSEWKDGFYYVREWQDKSSGLFPYYESLFVVQNKLDKNFLAKCMMNRTEQDMWQ